MWLNLFFSFFLQAFPCGSPLVSYISRATLNVTEDKDKMTNIMRKYFSSQTTSTGNSGSAEISTYSPSLGVYCFGGLFIIVVVASLFSLLLYVVKKFPHFHWINASIVPLEGSLWLRFIELVKHFNQKCLRSWSFSRNESTPSPEGLELHLV